MAVANNELRMFQEIGSSLVACVKEKNNTD